MAAMKPITLVIVRDDEACDSDCMCLSHEKSKCVLFNETLMKSVASGAFLACWQCDLIAQETPVTAC